jgi:hypothetical protein
MSSGKLVTLGLLLLAVLAAAFAWWNTWAKGQRALDYWGSRGAYRIRLAPEVTYFELTDAPPQTGQAVLQIGPHQHRSVVSQKDISRARGLVHARQALIQDASYNWNAAVTVRPLWSHAFRFSDPEGSQLVLFDLEHALVAMSSDSPPLNMNLASGFRTLFAEHR